MFYLISYDISDNKRRNKIAGIMKDYGKRVQYSVFECELEDSLMEKLVFRVNNVLSMKEDSVRIYSQCKQCLSGVVILGKGEITKDDSEVWIV